MKATTEGFCLIPKGSPDHLTENEEVWLEFLRLVSEGRDPALRFRDVQILRRLLRRHRGKDGR